MDRSTALLVVAGAMLLASPCLAETSESGASPTLATERTDYLFPRAGRFSASVASGVPFLGIGELTYGVTERFAIGALGAATPDVGAIDGTAAVGLRPRGVVVQAGRWRSGLVVPVLYYPTLRGFGGERDPWVLVRPELTLERSLDSGVELNVALGLVAAACTESLATFGREHSANVMGGVWDTVRVGGGVPIGGRTSLFGEASLVMTGVKPATTWLGVAPVIALAGVTVGL
jgi:hypothetical protein